MHIFQRYDVLATADFLNFKNPPLTLFHIYKSVSVSVHVGKDPQET